ncbi:MAG: hypothetical protein LQ340_000761 [Diploschistes diacapsis]|nr:MAG: hypothetical protein LQ340_000761 [Diploschistes diacapsis]
MSEAGSPIDIAFDDGPRGSFSPPPLSINKTHAAKIKIEPTERTTEPGHKNDRKHGLGAQTTASQALEEGLPAKIKPEAHATLRFGTTDISGHRNSAGESSGDQGLGSEGFKSEEDVAHFRAALHDDESPALTEDGKIIRNAKKARSGYFNLKPKRNDSSKHNLAGKHSFSMHSSVSITPSTDAGNTNAAAAYLSRATSSPGFTGLAAGNPFADAGLTSLGTFLRGGKGDDNDSDDIQSDTVSSATGAIGKVKGKGRPLSNPRSDLIPKDATSTTNTGSTGPISSKKPKKRKLKSSNKRKPQRAQIPASSAGASAAAVANAPLPSFDVADFLARRASQDAAIKAELQRCEQRHEQLLGMLACWLEVAKTREWERADARLRTRMAKLRQEEEGLRAKEEHRDQVVGAFKEVLGMLGDGDDSGSDEDEDGDDDEAMGEPFEGDGEDDDEEIGEPEDADEEDVEDRGGSEDEDGDGDEGEEHHQG